MSITTDITVSEGHKFKDGATTTSITDIERAYAGSNSSQQPETTEKTTADFEPPKPNNVNIDSDTDSGDAESRRGAGRGEGGECTWVGGTMNLIKTMIGAGILALPYANSQVGWGMGLFTLFFSAICTYLGFVLLTRCADWMALAPSSYGKLCEMVYPRAAWSVDLIVLLSCFGSGLGYLIIIGDLLPQVATAFGVARDSFLAHRLFWIALMFVVFDIPLTCLKNIDKLSYTSGIAFLSIVYVVVLGLLFLIAPAGAPALNPCANVASFGGCSGEIVPVTTLVGFVRALPTFIFAFNAHFIIFNIYDSLRRPTVAKMEVGVVVPSTLLTTCIYGGFGLFGYFTYGSTVASNILVNFPDTTPVTIARLLMSFVVAVTYPLYMHAARAAALNLMTAGFRAAGKQERVKTEKVKCVAHWVVTLALLGLSFLIVSFLSNLGVVISLVGTLCGVPIGFILPGLFYCTIFGPMRKEDDPSHMDTLFEKVLWWSGTFLVVFGVVFLPFALVFIFV